MAIYPIEPALARRGLYMLLFPLILHRYFSIITLIGARSGPGIASHSFAMTSINSSRLNATWYYLSKAFKSLMVHGTDLFRSQQLIIRIS